MSLAKGFGGNKPLFEHLQYYRLDKQQDIKIRYQHRALQWYRKRHLAFMEGSTFTEERPVRNMEEAYALSKKELGVFGSSVSKTAGETQQKLKAMKLGTKMGSFWKSITKKKAKDASLETAD